MSPQPDITGFRKRLLVRMMLVICIVTGTALWVAQQKVSRDAEQQLEQAFQEQISALHRTRDVRNAALLERSRSLARKPRLHAALEDNALDLLYPNAEDELRDVMEVVPGHPLQARFYRFLDSTGKVIPAPPGFDAGALTVEDESRLSLPGLPETQQLGYLSHDHGVDEVLAAPIISTDTGEVIASIVLGFKPFDLNGRDPQLKSGIWTGGRLFLSTSSDRESADLADALRKAPTGPQFEVMIGGEKHLVISRLLNPGSQFPPAHEVFVFSLAKSAERQANLIWQILGAGAVLLLAAGVASHLIAMRLAVPVEELAVSSARNKVQREQAEAALAQTSVELQRSMRFSADTSHQLKTPITVLRAGLEEIREAPCVTEEIRSDINDLIFQTTKISSMIHDLLLLSRLDAGRLELQMTGVDLTRFIDSLADDLSVVPGAPDFQIMVDVPPNIRVLGEKRYMSMILQNLLENAWKYNVPSGIISITARTEGETVFLRIGNSGAGIPKDAQEHVFDRFHRASVGENIPGHGLGLNIARELALLHGGDLRLVVSENGWTEFEVCFRIDRSAPTS